MTSRSLQASSHYLQAPFVTGAPGPPSFRLATSIMKEEDDEEMFYAPSGRGEPDDLGDLMQEMREGAAWVEELTLEVDLPLGASEGPAGPFASPSHTPQPPSRLGPADMDMAAKQQQQRQQREAEAPLQPCMAAKLMHPGAARGGADGGAQPLSPSGHMIPVALPGGRYKPEPGMAPDGWLQPLHYYCGGSPASPPSSMAAAAAAMHQAAAAAYFGQPMPPQQCGSPSTASLAGYQMPPPTFLTGGMPLPLPRSVFAQGAATGCDTAQHLPQPAACQGGHSMMMHLPQPNSSTDASSGSKLRLRSSMSQGNDSGSGSNGCSEEAAGHGQATATHFSAVPQPSGVSGLAAFDDDARAAFGGGTEPAKRVGSGGCDASLAPAGVAAYCDAPSESSDNEEGAGAAALVRQGSQAQVVPDLRFLGQPLLGGDLALPPPPLPHAGCAPDGATPFSAFPPMPAPYPCYALDTPAAQAARLARQRSMERYREKKARRGFGKKIRYQARKANADKRPRVKGRFVKADEAADILAAANASALAAAAGPSHSSGTLA